MPRRVRTRKHFGPEGLGREGRSLAKDGNCTGQSNSEKKREGFMRGTYFAIKRRA